MSGIIVFETIQPCAACNFGGLDILGSDAVASNRPTRLAEATRHRSTQQGTRRKMGFNVI